jgi:hypothetical protein
LERSTALSDNTLSKKNRAIIFPIILQYVKTLKRNLPILIQAKCLGCAYQKDSRIVCADC